MAGVKYINIHYALTKQLTDDAYLDTVIRFGHRITVSTIQCRYHESLLSDKNPSMFYKEGHCTKCNRTVGICADGDLCYYYEDGDEPMLMLQGHLHSMYCGKLKAMA